MRVITAKRIWEAKAKWPHSSTALDEWYRKIKVICPEDFSALRSFFPAADKVKENKRSITLEPMYPNERRIIHTALQKDPRVTTKSVGKEPNRRVVISLK